MKQTFAAFTLLAAAVALKGLPVRCLAQEAPRHVSSAASIRRGPRRRSELARRAERTLAVEDAVALSPLVVDSILFAQQPIQLTADDGAFDDGFGWSVAVDGNTAVVGANDKSVGGNTFQGAAYVFIRSGDTWTLQQELTADDGIAAEHFGSSVAISGDTIIVGADGDDINVAGDDQGSAYVFVRDRTTWAQQQKLALEGSVPEAFFGHAVAIRGDTAIVGAPSGSIDPSHRRAGGAYVFIRNDGAWSLQQALISGEIPAVDALGGSDFFGVAVAIGGETVIVGAEGIDAGSTLNTGAAFVFADEAGVWSLQQKLTADDATASDGFGTSVAISGDTAIVGVASPGPQLREAAYVFARSGVVWTQEARLTAESAGDAAMLRGFGRSVALSGHTAVVGAFNDRFDANHQHEGSAYVFVRSSADWPFTQKLSLFDAMSFDDFGFSVAAGAGEVLVGAGGRKIGSNLNQGAVYVYEPPDSDGDGLPDDWETNGVTLDGEFIDLPAMGANPMHKDVFVHVDWMGQDPARPAVVFKPDARAMKIVADAFAVAPVANPDGRPGIDLHVDLGPTSVLSYVTGATTTWGALSRAGEVPFETPIGSEDANGVYDWSAVDAVKTLHFGPSKRRQVFHYALFANSFDAEGHSGLSRNIGAADFIVTLGDFDTPGGTVLEQAGTFMHELGHNLGLHHGGDEDVNNKPNYLSVMNYSFQMTGVLQPLGPANVLHRGFDYSRSALPPLDERNLDELVGIGDPEMHLTFWSKRPRVDANGTNACLENPDTYFELFFPTDALDWNCDGAKTPLPVTADINGDGRCVGPGDNLAVDSVPAGDDVLIRGFVVAGPNRTCETKATGDDTQESPVGFVQPNVLKGFDDWPALVFGGGGAIGSLGAGFTGAMLTPNHEPTAAQIHDVVPQALFDEELVAPLDVVTLSPLTGGAPLPVSFDGGASTATSGTIVEWKWDFGDGASGSGAMAMHTYTTPGEYYARLTVTDSNGHVNLVPSLHRVVVTNGPPPPTPTSNGTPGSTPISTPTGIGSGTATPHVATPTRTPTPTGGATPPPSGSSTPGATPSLTPTPLPGPGDVDPSFEAAVTQNILGVHAALIQPDGKVLVGGGFESFGGAPERGVGRVDADGTADATFRPGLALPFDRINAYVGSLALQPDGKILVGVVNAASAAVVVVRLRPDGSLDPSFHVDICPSVASKECFDAFQASVYAIAVQPDGKILVGGTFSYRNAANVKRYDLVRLNADGSFDGTFDLSSGSPAVAVYCLALRPDGKILIGGGFAANSDFLPRTGIARLNGDGSLDDGFDLGLPGFDRGFAVVTRVRAMAIQPDGKIVAGGVIDFDGTNQHNEIIARFDSNGTRDGGFSDAFPSFAGGNFYEIRTLALAPDGKVVIGGTFTTSAGSNQLGRLDADGTLDGSFDLGGNFTTQGTLGAASVNAVGVRTTGPDAGKVIVAGDFIVFSGVAVEGLIQLDAGGSLDGAFASNGPGTDAEVLALAQQPDGKLLVGFDPPISGITITRVNESTQQAIGRLDVDGATDATFTSPFVHGTTIVNRVSGIAVQPDGKIIVSGSFRLPGGSDNVTLARLDANGSVDTTFVPYVAAGGGPVVAVQADGKIITNGFTTGPGLVRLNTDGSRDQTFKVLLGSDGRANAVAILPDGRLLVGGSFSVACGELTCLARNNVARVLQDGNVDAEFDPATGADDVVLALARQPDGKALIAGHFFDVAGTPRPSIARLNTNGTLDGSFVPVNPNVDQFGFALPVSALAVQADGKVVFGSHYGSATPDRVQRLNSDGSLDAEFDHGAGANGDVNALVIEWDGRIVAGGRFDVVDDFASLALTRLIPFAAGVTPLPTPTTTAATATPARTATATSTPLPTGTPTPVSNGTLGSFLGYGVSATKGAPKFQKLGPITLTDPAFASGTAVDVAKLVELDEPASVDGNGPVDAVTRLASFAVKLARGSAFTARTGVTVVNGCGSVVVTASKPTTLLVPTAEDATGAVAPPAEGSHDLDHFLCYAARTQKKTAAGVPIAGLAKGAQVDVADVTDSQRTRRYDLKKVVALCNPVATSGDPVVLAGPNKGLPVPLTPADVRNPGSHLVCYAATLAKNAIAQSSCGAANPKDKGMKIVPAQTRRAAQLGVHVADDLAVTQLDSEGAMRVCIPSTVAVP